MPTFLASGFANDADNVTTGSFTPTSGALLVVLVVGAADDSTGPTISDSEGLTWTTLDTANRGGYANFAGAWSTVIGTGVSMTVTVDAGNGGGGMFRTGLTATEFEDFNATTPIPESGVENNNDGTRTGSISISMGTTSETDSTVLAMGTVSNTTPAAGDITPGTGWTELDEHVGGGEAGTFSLQYIEGAVSSLAWDAYDIDSGYGSRAEAWVEVAESVASGDTEISAAVDALVLTEQQATITVDHNIAATTDALVLAELAATITVANDTNIAAATDALTLATLAATVSVDHEISATTDAMTLVTLAASISIDHEINATTDALTLATHQATISVQTGIVTNVHEMALTELPASIAVDHNILATTDALTLTGLAASIVIGVNVLAATATLTVTEHQAIITGVTSVQASTAALTLATHAATVDGTEYVAPVSETTSRRGGGGGGADIAAFARLNRRIDELQELVNSMKPPEQSVEEWLVDVRRRTDAHFAGADPVITEPVRTETTPTPQVVTPHSTVTTFGEDIPVDVPASKSALAPPQVHHRDKSATVAKLTPKFSRVELAAMKLRKTRVN